MYVVYLKSNHNRRSDLGLLVFSNLIASGQFVCEKWDKQASESCGTGLRKLLVRHSFSNGEMSGLLGRVIVMNVEPQMLPDCAGRLGHTNIPRDPTRGASADARSIAQGSVVAVTSDARLIAVKQ
jgi:hypothetical protein